MNLLHTFAFSSHKLYVYDIVDTDFMERGSIHASINPAYSCYCPGVGCSSSPCHFHNAEGGCTSAIKSFIREQLSPTYPEYFL